ncbi:MAG TPA: ComEC/Rec2 family competence protein [Gaiellaceae bacterium]
MTADLLLRRYPHCLAGAACVGLAAADLARCAAPTVAALAAALAILAAAEVGAMRLVLAGCALALAGWWWGSARLDALDASTLRGEVGRAETGEVVVTGPPRRGRFELRLPAQVRRFGRLRPNEQVLLELPLGRSPPQGAVLRVLGQIELPRGPSNGFDETTWLRRHGVHVVLHGDRWSQIGRRGGFGGVADRLRAWLGRSVATGLRGERRALLEGVVLGDDQRLSADLRRDFRASGLYHLLAVSGQNVALVAGGVLLLGWLVGIPRAAGELGALAAMAGYVVAVGAQPSVVRAGIAGALGSLAWLSARQRDRWQFLLLGALALLAWNPYALLDAGFQLSFAAVAAIFTVAPRLRRVLDGYPIPAKVADAVAVSTACGGATAPIAWFQFHAVPLLTVPANAAAEIAVVPLLGFALAAAAVAPFSTGAAAALAWLAGGCAAYLAACARFFGGLPFAQVRSGQAAAALATLAVAAAAYAWRRWRPS